MRKFLWWVWRNIPRWTAKSGEAMTRRWIMIPTSRHSDPCIIRYLQPSLSFASATLFWEALIQTCNQFDEQRRLTRSCHKKRPTWSYAALRRQTAVPTCFSSEQLLLFVFAGRYRRLSAIHGQTIDPSRGGYPYLDLTFLLRSCFVMERVGSVVLS